MRVGALEEAIVVTGDSPIVDTRTATTTQVISREVWDTLPSAHNVQAVAQLMPGVRMNQSDVGGSQAMQQQQFLVRGINGANNTVSFDGMNLNSLLVTARPFRTSTMRPSRNSAFRPERSAQTRRLAAGA